MSDQLREAVGPLDGQTIEIHAGSADTDAIRGLLSAQGATAIEPLAGLTMGARLAWYGSTAAPSSPDAPTPITEADVVELLGSLTRADEAITPAALLADDGDRLRSPGLYSWWASSTRAPQT